MYNKEWITYCKPPFQDAKSVIKYLGRYTHRVAISNGRIVKEENGEVTFKYRDYKNNKKTKLVECKRLTNTANLEKLEISTLEILKKTLGVNFNLCPICHKGHLLSPNTG